MNWKVSFGGSSSFCTCDGAKTHSFNYIDKIWNSLILIISNLNIIKGRENMLRFLSPQKIDNIVVGSNPPGLGFRSFVFFTFLLSSPFLKEQCEQFAPVALFKRATRAKSTRAIRSLLKSDLLFLRVGFASFWRENWQLDLKIYITLFSFVLFFVKKTSDSQQKPNSEFPTLESTQNNLYKSSRNTSSLFFFSVGHESEAVEKLFCWKMTFISSRVNDSQLHICTGKKIAPTQKKNIC